MIIHLSHDTLLQNSTLSPCFFFHPWQICHAAKQEHFLLAPNFRFSFSTAQHTYRLKIFLYHGYYNKHTQRALHHTNNITVIIFLTLVLCSFDQHISLVINKICQWLTFGLKWFQQRLSCSRGFTVYVTYYDWFTQTLLNIKTESENNWKNTAIHFPSFFSFSTWTRHCFHHCLLCLF